MQAQRRHRQQRADGDLDERQWNGDELRSDARAADDQQHDQDGVEKLHAREEAARGALSLLPQAKRRDLSMVEVKTFAIQRRDTCRRTLPSASMCCCLMLTA